VARKFILPSMFTKPRKGAFVMAGTLALVYFNHPNGGEIWLLSTPIIVLLVYGFSGWFARKNLHVYQKIGRFVILIVGCSAAVFLYAWHFWPSPADDLAAKIDHLQKQLSAISVADEPQPGFSAQMVLTLPKQSEDFVVHYILDYGWRDKTRFSVYLNRDGSVLTFAILDGNGKRYSVDAPTGSEIPLDTPFNLSASVGYGSESSQMGLFVDGKKVRGLFIDNQVNTDYAKNGGIMGCDLDHKNGVTMTAYYLALYDRTLGKPEIDKMTQYLRQVIRDRGIKALPYGTKQP
jgi:hypothetical protein